MENFFAQYGLFIILGLMMVFMIFSSRRRRERMKQEQEKKQRDTVPGARVLLQGGLYGTVVEFDGIDLDKPARIEIAPGVVIDVHSQAILRLVTDQDEETEQTPLDDTVGSSNDDVSRPETPDETRARLEDKNDDN